MHYRRKINKILFLLSFGLLISCNGNNTEITQRQLFDLNWKFTYGNNNFASEIKFKDQNWRNLDLPHNWSEDIEFSTINKKNKTGFEFPEVGWYRKYFEVPENWQNKNISIDFEGISGQNDIYINGISIESLTKDIDSGQKLISPYLNYKGNNTIAIKVANSSQEEENNSKPNLGIYKHIWLVIEVNDNK